MGCCNYLKRDVPKEIEELDGGLVWITYKFLSNAKTLLFNLQFLIENMLFPVHIATFTWKAFLPFFTYLIPTHLSMLRVWANSSGSLSDCSREMSIERARPVSQVGHDPVRQVFQPAGLPMTQLSQLN